MYPANPLSAYALLQLASCEHRLGNTPTSISTLRGMLSRYPASEFADKGQFSRITSYNVCYTKLLRFRMYVIMTFLLYSFFVTGLPFLSPMSARK